MKKTFLFFVCFISLNCHWAENNACSGNIFEEHTLDGEKSNLEDGFLVRSWEIEGVTLFKIQEIQHLLKSYSETKISFTELREASLKIEKYYEDKGFLAKVIIPPQDVTEGVVQLEVLEARIGEIRIEKGGSSLVDDQKILSIVRSGLAEGEFYKSNALKPRSYAPVNISASTIVIEESINAQMFDISASGQEGFINNVEYGVSAESSVSIESTVLQTSGITSQQGASSSSSGVNQTDNELGMKIEMVAPPDELSTGIVAVTIPQSTAVAGTGFSFGLPEEISSLVSSSQSEFTINLESGAPLPSWISYNQESGKFVSSAVPDGAFPLKVIMNVDGKRIAVVISERQE